MPESVVTPERYAKGFTFPDYVAQIKVNREHFARFYQSGVLTADDAVFFRRATEQPGGLGKMMAIGEDWCPDAFRGLPVIARIAEMAGVELRIFPRDANMDIMNEFLNQGKYTSIPVAVFYTRELKHLCHWIERPALANEERARIEAEVKREMAGATEQEVHLATRKRTQERYPAWQQASIAEMRAMLAKALGI